MLVEWLKHHVEAQNVASHLSNQQVKTFMTSRERVLSTLNFKTPDRIPVMEHFWEDMLERWYGEGLSRDVCLNDHFDFDIIEMGIDALPRFETYVVDENDKFRTIQDRFGYVAKMYKGISRPLDYLSHPVPDRVSWQSVKDMFTLKSGEKARTDNILFPFRISSVLSWDELNHYRLKPVDSYCD